MSNEHPLTTYIRTKIVFQQRLKDLPDYDKVKIYQYELKKLGFDSGPLLYKLKLRGEIWYDNLGNFSCLRPGRIDPGMLKITTKTKPTVKLSPMHTWMRDQLLHVEIKQPRRSLPVYFQAFLEHRKTSLSTFFTVDTFCGRVHTPVVNLKGHLRKYLRFYNGPVDSLDVKQMQPLILGKVLDRNVGDNPFSDAIKKGKDVYVMILERSSVTTRDEAKKLFFNLIFGKPKDDIGLLFEGDTRWVEWINNYKRKVEPLNPHKNSTHTNLAWLLQYSEVQVMSEIWNRLYELKIPFLTIHDDILCRVQDSEKTSSVMKDILSSHFVNFEVIRNH